MNVLAPALGALLLVALETPAPKPAQAPAPTPPIKINVNAPVTPVTPGAPVRPVTPLKPAAPAGPGGTASIESTTYEAGDVHKGDVITHDFTVKNTGDHDLLILDVKPACGCTTPGFDKIVAPGKSGKITLKVDTATFKGPIEKTATVTTNDPERTSVRLTMRANVTTYVDVLPKDSLFFRHFLGEEKRESLTIRSNEPGAFTIKDVRVTNAPVKHELKPSEDKPGEYVLTVWVDPATPVGSFNGTLNLLTSSPKEPEVKIAVNGAIMGHLSVNPSSLFYRIDSTTKQVVAKGAGVEIRERGESDAPVLSKTAKDARLNVLEEVGTWMRVGTETGTQGWVAAKAVEPAPSGSLTQTKVVNVVHRAAKPFKVTSTALDGAKIPATAMKVESAPASQGGGFQVSITYAGGLAAGSYNTVVVIKTDTKEEPEVRIPVYIVIT